MSAAAEGKNDATPHHGSKGVLHFEDGKAIRHLMWEREDHWFVLTRRYGSIWPDVILFCIGNVGLTYIVYVLKNSYDVDLTSDSVAHKFMSTLMAFLVVTRLNMTYGNYMANSSYISDLYKSCRELAQYACLLTMEDTSDSAKQWRQDVVYHTIMLLRVTMEVVEYENDPNLTDWDLPELSDENRELSQDDDLKSDEAFRAPVILMYNLRREIMKQRDGTWIRRAAFHHPCNEELKMLDFVSDFHKAFAGLKKFMTNPVPFPFVQMSKTFLFVWLFTLPLAICHEKYSDPWDPMILVFLITFGFLGLEVVAMQLSDPFGDDPVDFDNLGYAQLCFEDCYISVFKIDGKEWAHKLRSRVHEKCIEANALRQYQRKYKDDWDSLHWAVDDDEILEDLLEGPDDMRINSW